ncbi:MAG: alpha/beta hydrolase, partial [Bacteroidia bacterium]|nr:alpha/beta hydrolase [Bacteroidia bacterium]
LFFLFIVQIRTLSAGLPDSLKSESAIVLETKTGKIFGKIVAPASKKPIPLVLIVAGSGPTDLNGNNYAGLKTDAYKMLAEELRKAKIASVRYDKRGIGKSAAAFTSENDLRFDDYVNDVIDWIALLKKDPRFSKIIVLGHSEGSLLGMIACTKTNADAYISLAGCGSSADKILKEQFKAQPKMIADDANAILDSLVAGKNVERINPLLLSVFRPSIQPYMMSWFKYDPAKEIAKLKIPVSIIQGTTDLQVKEKDANDLFKAKPDASLSIIKNMNHVLKDIDDLTVKNQGSYSDASLPLKTEFLEVVLKFIKELK